MTSHYNQLIKYASFGEVVQTDGKYIQLHETVSAVINENTQAHVKT